MSPKNFMMWVGWILLVLGIVGFLVPELIPGYLWLTPAENWAHTLLGIVALAVAYGVKDHTTMKWFAVIYGVVPLVFGIWGFLVAANPPLNFYNIAHLDNPLDNIIHLVVGIWGLWAAFGGKQA